MRLNPIDYLVLTAIAVLMTLMWSVSGCHPLYHRPPVETERRKAEVRMLDAQAEVWKACSEQIKQGRGCEALEAKSPVTIQREPDSKSPITVDMPFF